MAYEGTGTSNQILQSQGAGEPSKFSTATYPATTTANQILYSSATNTVGQITTANNSMLVTNSSGVPSFQLLAGNQVLISTQSPSGVGTVDFTGLGNTYDVLIAEWINVVGATNATTFTMRVGTGAGPSWDSGTNYEYSSITISANGGTSGNTNTATGDTRIQVSFPAHTNNSSSGGSSGRMYIYGISAAHYKLGTWNNQYFNNSSVGEWVSGGFRYTSTTAVTGVRFLFDAGNISSGTFNLYGVAK